jgi:hypothetical protein
MRDVGRRAFALGLDPALGHRLVSADHVQGCIGETGYLGSLPDGLTG